MEKIVYSLEVFEAEAARFASSLTPSATGATLVTLSGELGAGKTTFTQSVARALGVSNIVTSPTFVLEKIYPLPETQTFVRLIHIDAYRLNSGADLNPLNFNELLKDSGNLILLEWPERVVDALPPPAVKISFAVHGAQSRTISYE